MSASQRAIAEGKRLRHALNEIERLLGVDTRTLRRIAEERLRFVEGVDAGLVSLRALFRDAEALELRAIQCGGRPMRFREIGERLGVTGFRAGQIVRRAADRKTRRHRRHASPAARYANDVLAIIAGVKARP